MCQIRSFYTIEICRNCSCKLYSRIYTHKLYVWIEFIYFAILFLFLAPISGIMLVLSIFLRLQIEALSFSTFNVLDCQIVVLSLISLFVMKFNSFTSIFSKYILLIKINSNICIFMKRFEDLLVRVAISL